MSVPSSRRYDGIDTPQSRQHSHEAVRDLVQRPTSVPRPLSLSWVPAESCSLLDDIGQLSRRVRVEELEKIVQHFLSARLSTSAKTDSMSQSKSWACLRASVPRS